MPGPPSNWPSAERPRGRREMLAFPDLMPALPEIFLACAGMALLLLGAFRGDSSTRLVSSLVVLSFVVTGVLVVALVPSRAVTFSGLFVVDGFAAFMKLLILLG